MKMSRTFTLILGVVLLVVGVCGIATGGHNHPLVVFGVNANHNWVHVVSGAIALLAALGGERNAQVFCLGFGTVYGLVAVAGFFRMPYLVGLLNLNMADDFLHLAIATSCLLVGGLSKGPGPTTSKATIRS
jgi:hypothetical protein